MWSRRNHSWTSVLFCWVLSDYTYQWFTSHIWWHFYTYKWVASHVQTRHIVLMNIRHVTRTNTCPSYESCPSYEWVMSHIQIDKSHLWRSHDTPWISLVTRMNGLFCAHVNESRHTYKWTHRTYEWVTSHVRTRCAPHMNTSGRTCEQITSHIWMSHVTHTIETHRT